MSEESRGLSANERLELANDFIRAFKRKNYPFLQRMLKKANARQEDINQALLEAISITDSALADHLNEGAAPRGTIATISSVGAGSFAGTIVAAIIADAFGMGQSGAALLFAGSASVGGISTVLLGDRLRSKYDERKIRATLKKLGDAQSWWFEQMQNDTAKS